MMDYGLFLYADLATGERIEILKRDFGGAPRKIAALSSWSWRPLDNDSAEVTDTPIVKGTLSLSIKDMRDFDYTAFFTVDATLWRVVLKYGGITRWSGYVQPESYSSNSEYRSDINIMALDNLGQLEHIEYNYFDSPFVSLRSLVSKACELVGWNFAPVVLDTQIISGDGVLIEDAVLNVETFRKKTWWEVLSDVLLSFGLQWAYFDNNEYRISSVANKFDPTRIVDIPDYTIEGGCTSDIVPPWKSASVEQNLQIINDFFYFPSGSDYSVVGSCFISAYNEKYKNDTTLADWSIWPARLKTLITNDWELNNGCNMFSGNSMLNGRDSAMYLETIIKDTDEIALSASVSKRIDIPAILAGASIELSLGSREWSVLWEDFADDWTEQDPIPSAIAEKFAPWPAQSFEILYSFQVNYGYVDGDGVAQKLILKDSWEKLSDANKDSRIEFTAKIEKEVSDKKHHINIVSFPAPGSLELKIFRPKLINAGSIIKEGATSFCRIADIKMSALPKIEIGSTKTNIGIIKSARTKKELSLSYGELPPKHTCIDYAGGVFKDVRFNPALHDWHRTDNLGGVLPLSEIVWRGYVHNFSRFQTNAGEPAGGKVLRGVFPFDGLKLNAILRFSTPNFTEYYAINSASISGREAELTLMQVSPYAHYTDFDIENYVDAGGGSFVGGGGDTYVTHMTGGGGADLNGKRLFALDEASEEEIDDLYLLADKPGIPGAKKIRAKVIADRIGKHAKQHFKDGEDAIKPYDIDAAQRAGDGEQDFTAREVITPTAQSPVFQTGIVRSGYRISTNPDTNRSTLEIGTVIADELVVDVLTYQKVQAIGGVLILSQAWAEITKVEHLGGAYRCYYKPDFGAQFWRVGDQALCKNAGRYYWRLVTSVSADATQEGEHWFNLSVATADGQGVPIEGDEVVLLGHRGQDLTRRSATVLSSGTMGYPNPITHYKGINSFTLSGKERLVIGDESRFVGKSFTIEDSDGTLHPMPIDRGAWMIDRKYAYYDRVSHKGEIWLCIAPDGTMVEPSAAAVDGGLWLLEVAKGEDGQGWRYQMQIYRWTDEANPARPVGVDAPGWTTDAMCGRVMLDASGRVLTDQNGTWLVGRYPASYKLWGCVGTFDGVSEQLIGVWGSPFMISGTDGKGQEFVFTRQNSPHPPPTPPSVDHDNYVPPGWTDDQVGVAANFIYEFSSHRVKANGVWGDYSQPAVWARYSFDGANGANGADGKKGDKGDKGDKGADGTPGADIDPVLAAKMKAEAINAWVGGGAGSQEQIQSILLGEGSPFMVVDNVVVMRAAFIGRLAVELLKADTGFVRNLIAEHISTRIGGSGAGIVMARGSRSAEFFDAQGRRGIVISDGTNAQDPVLSMTSYSRGLGVDLYPSMLHFTESSNPSANKTDIGYYGLSGTRNVPSGASKVFEFSEGAAFLPQGAVVNMPGVALCIGTVGMNGHMVSQWGPVWCSVNRDALGRRLYQITHNLGHKNYHLDVTPYMGSNGDGHFAYTIAFKSENYITFGIVFSDSNVPAHTDFDFKLCGDSKKR